MAAAFVQATNGSNGSSPFSTTFTTSAFGSSTTSGNAILIAISYDASAGGTFTSVTDSKGNTYTAVGAVFVDANTNSCRHFYNLNIVGGASHTITVNAGGVGFQFLRVVAHEVSGLLTSAALDKDSGGNSVTATSGSATSVTPTTDGQYIFASGLNAGGTATDTLSPGSGFTEPANSTGGPAANELMCEYQVQTTATAVAAGFTRSSSGLMTMRTSTFKASSVAAAALVPPLTVPVSQVVGKFKPWFRQQLWNFDYPVQGGLTNPVMPADVGAITVAGQPAILRFGHNMPAAVGALTVNGQAAGLQHGYKVTATLGTITLAGQPVTLTRTRVMPAAVGAITVNGLAVTLRYAHMLPATLGTITINGQPVTLTRSPRNMAAGLATITLGGQSVALRYSRVPLTATLGTITVSGQAAILRRGYMLAATLGQIVLSGQAVTLRRTRVMPATVGAITIAGQPVILRVGHMLKAGLGQLTIGGQPVGLRHDYRVVAMVGAITLNGQPVTLRQTHLMTAGVGAITLFGRVVNLVYSAAGAKVLPASLGLISLGGQPVTLRYARRMPAALGAVTVNGLPVKLAIGHRLAAGSGSLVLAGQNVTLTYAPAAVIRHLVMPAAVCALVLDRKQVNLDFRQQPGVFTFGRRVTIPNRW
jgi:hypothetical protein